MKGYIANVVIIAVVIFAALRVSDGVSQVTGPQPTATPAPVLLCAERVQAGDKHIALEWYALGASPVYTYWRDPINIEVQLVTIVRCGSSGDRDININWEVGSGTPNVTWTP